ncbi:MAG: hypothetical protein ACRETN_02960 [Nevskiales bacterium]
MPNIFFASLIDLLVAGTAGIFWYLNALSSVAKLLFFLFLGLFALNLIVGLIGRLAGEWKDQDAGAVFAPIPAAYNE